MSELPTGYAEAQWVASDVASLRPDWTEEQAEEWLSFNEKYIRDAMIRAGWSAIETLLPPEGEGPST